MAYGAFDANKVQLGRETTAGTAVAATAIWRGEFSMLEDARERKIVEEQVGAFWSVERAYDANYLAKWQQPSIEMTYEQVLHILEAGVKTATPTGSGPYVYVYNYPASGVTVNTIKTYTIEAGNAIVTGDVREVEYCFVEDFEFTGKFGEAWMMQSNWLGRQMSASTFTAALTIPTVEQVLFNKTLLYIDASGGTIGTTVKSGVLMDASVKVKTGLVVVPVASGQLYFQTHKFAKKPEVTFSITIELEDTAGLVTAERAIWESNAVRLIRLKASGTGTSVFQLDMAAKYDAVGAYQNQDGDTVVTLTGHAVASTTDSLAFTTTVTNSLSAVP